MYMEAIYPFKYFEYDELYGKIMSLHKNVIVNEGYLAEVIKTDPMELGYILALLTPHIEIKSHPPKILHTYSDIVKIQKIIYVILMTFFKSLTN